MASDALLVSALNKGDGGKNAPKLRDGWYKDADGQRVVQPMQQPGTGVQKGLQSILRERGLWPAAGMTVPAARKRLAEEPDFMAQKGRLVERMVDSEQFVLMLPKYHCEFNFIENLWGRMKVYLRRNCSYDFAALQTSIPEAVASVPLAVLHAASLRTTL